MNEYLRRVVSRWRLADNYAAFCFLLCAQVRDYPTVKEHHEKIDLRHADAVFDQHPCR